MIRIDNDALHDGRVYGTIIKEDFEAARRVLSPEAMLDWVELALQRHGFEWKYPDISRKGIEEMERAGYLRPYGAEDWLFCAEPSDGAVEDLEQSTNHVNHECYYQPISSSKALPPDPSRVFKNWEAKTNAPNAAPGLEALYQDEELPF